MRFYSLLITDQSGAPVFINDGQNPFAMSITSYTAGMTTPGALNIELDIPIITAEIPAGNAYCRIWGLPLSIINKAKSLNNMNIQILAGMQRGFPLANLQVTASPPRNGIIFSGTIFQAFGNWQGGEQTLDLVLTTQLNITPTASKSPVKPIVFQCVAGSPMQAAIEQTLQNLGVISPQVAISPLLVASADSSGWYPNMTTFAQAMLALSKQIIVDPNYLGVKCIKTPAGYNVTDNSLPADTPISIDFTDLIGQPVWLDFNTVQMKTVMRSDTKVGSTVSMPKNTNVLNTAQGLSQFKNNISYTGTAFVHAVRHIGNYRQQDANSWVTILDTIPTIQPTQ